MLLQSMPWDCLIVLNDCVGHDLKVPGLHLLPFGVEVKCEVD